MRPFFVIGPPKTGTTVVTRLLVQHPDVTSLSESWVLEPNDPASICHPKGQKGGLHGFTRGDAERWTGYFRTESPADALRKTLGEAFASMADRTGAGVVGDSWPFYPFHLPLLRAAFPDARYVYTVRDPRAVYWSGETFKGRHQGIQILTQVLRADRRVRAFVEKDIEQGRAAIVRYETVMRRPEEMLGKLWEFLEVDPGKGWIDYDASRDPMPGRWSWVENATRAIDPTRCDRFQDEMPLEARRVASLAAAEYCAVYGYPVEIEEPYLPDEMVAAFLCGGSVSHYPIEIEDHVRSELLRLYLPALTAGLRGGARGAGAGVTPAAAATPADAAVGGE